MIARPKVRFARPHSMALSPSGSKIVVSDCDNHVLRLVTLGPGRVGCTSTVSYYPEKVLRAAYGLPAPRPSRRTCEALGWDVRTLAPALGACGPAARVCAGRAAVAKPDALGVARRRSWRDGMLRQLVDRDRDATEARCKGLVAAADDPPQPVCCADAADSDGAAADDDDDCAAGPDGPEDAGAAPREDAGAAPAPRPGAARRRLADEPRRPDILFVLVDDVGWNDVPYHRLDDKKRAADQYPASDMPEVGKLARAGVRLDTRATAGQNARAETEEFMGDAFRRVGYETWAFGKWHLGNDAPSHVPLGRGYDLCYDYHLGFYCATVHAFDHTTSFSNRIVHDWHRDGDDSTGPGVDGVHADLLIGRDFADRLARRRSDRPLFTYFAPHLIHESKGHSDGVENVRIDGRAGADTKNAPLYQVPRAYLGDAPADVDGRYYSPWRVLGACSASSTPSSATAVAANVDWLPTLVGADPGTFAPRNALDGLDLWPVLSGDRPESALEDRELLHNLDVSRRPVRDFKGALRRGRHKLVVMALQKLEADVSTCWGLPHAVPPGEQEDCDNFPMKRDCHFDPDAKFISYKPGWCADHGSRDEYHAKKLLGEVPTHKDLAVEAGLWNRLPADEWV
ncbi:sulfatase [Aureococcus anophagefferens]|nr:sulfatase [Aureococcus anophagefferens]